MNIITKEIEFQETVNLHKLKSFTLSTQNNLNVCWLNSPTPLSVQMVWKPSSIDPPIWPSPPLCVLSNPPSHLDNIFFGNIAPIVYRANTKINSWGKVVSSWLEKSTEPRYILFFISNTFIWHTKLRFDSN